MDSDYDDRETSLTRIMKKHTVGLLSSVRGTTSAPALPASF
jgi:hypothetical protein